VTAVQVVADGDAGDALMRALRVLMEEAFDGDFSDDDWDHTCGGTRVLVEHEGRVVAHAAVVARSLEIGGRRFRAGYVEGVATAPRHQRRGLGTAVMREVDRVVRQHYEVGALGTEVQPFYERLGWERWQGPTFVRSPDGLSRTEEDDGGVMVLRFGPSAGADLAGNIVCEARRGDAW
jgi:aminoglycoside 2'-N-acetyltransferase I